MENVLQYCPADSDYVNSNHVVPASITSPFDQYD